MLKPILEIIYVYTKGVGWTPEAIREDVRHAAKRINFGMPGFVTYPRTNVRVTDLLPVGWLDDF